MHLRSLIGAALLAACALCLAAPVGAQTYPLQAIVVPTCGSVTLPTGDPRMLYMDATGALCTGGGAGGGSSGPPASSAIAVQRTTGIGTTGTLVSAADTTSRRTVTNTSTIACEIMGSAAAYGTGYPLPAGGSFTFDASGRTTAALYVACASVGGAVAVLSY